MKILYRLNQLPTTDLYFCFAVKEFKDKTYKQHTRFLIETKKAFIIIRYLNKRSLKIIQRNKNKKVYYIVDDNFKAMFNSDSLLPHYRKRIKKFYDNYHDTILENADHIVCSSPLLADNYQNHKVTVLEPYWPVKNIAPQQKKSDTILNIGWTATHTHINDLFPIIDQIKKFISENKICRFHIWIPKKHIPIWLKTCPNLVVHRYTRWNKYRKQLNKINLDVCLHPIEENNVNKSRSINKITEHASAGNLGLYSKWFIDLHKLDLPKECIVDNKPNSWHNILCILKNKNEHNKISTQFKKQALHYNTKAQEKQTNFWHNEVF